MADVLEDVCKTVEAKMEKPRLGRVLSTLKLYAAGKPVREIEKLTGQARVAACHRIFTGRWN